MANVNISTISGVSDMQDLINAIERQRKDIEFLLENLDDDNVTQVSFEKITSVEIDQAQIKNLLVDTANIKDLAVSSAKISDAAITYAKIQDAAIGNAKIDRASVNKLVVVTADIQDAAITTAKIGNAQITTALIGDAQITSAKIQKAQIISTHIADAQILTAHIADAQITKAKIGSAAIGTAQIEDASITTAKIGTGQVTTALIANAAITETLIKDASITDAKIVTVTANKLTAGTIDASKINVTNLVADNIVTGTITIASANIFMNTHYDKTVRPSTGLTAVKSSATLLGDTYLYMSQSETTEKFAYLDRVSLKPDSEVTITVTAIADSTANGADVFLLLSDTIEGTEANKTSAGYNTTDPAYTIWIGNASGGTQKLQKTVTLPSGVKSGYIRFDHNGSKTAGTTSVVRFTPIMVQYGKLGTAWQPHTNELLAEKGITNLQIGDSAVDNRVITANTITGDKLVVDAITTREIKAGSITAASGIIANATIGTAQIIDGSITTVKIGDAQITSAKIKELDASVIKSGYIDAARIKIGSATSFDPGFDPTKIEVGGRNYYKKTTTTTRIGGTATVTTNPTDVPNGFKATGVAANSVVRSYNVIDSNGEWTVSFKAKASATATLGSDLADRGGGTFSLTTSYQTFSYTVNITNFSTATYHFVDWNFASAADYYIDDIKVERGNRATDWTPAPEDVDNKIDSVDIGGTNLLKGTKDMSGNAVSPGTTDSYLGFTAEGGTAPSSGYKDIYSHRPTSLTELEYTFSFFAKSTNVTQGISCYFYNPNVATEGKTSTGNTNTAVDGSITMNVTNEWKRYWVTWKQSAFVGTEKGVLIRVFNGGNVLIAAPKFEKGNRATDWTPAPEDVDSSISTAQSTANSVKTLTDGWKYPGTTYIDGGDIYTNSITANQIASRTVTANEIVAGTITGYEIAAGTITTDKLIAGGNAANVAENRPTTVSAGDLNNGGPCAREINSGTSAGYWGSVPAGSSMVVDLQSQYYYITEFSFATWFVQDSRYIPKNYRIETSIDNSTWTNRVTVTNNTTTGWQVHSVNDISCRYVKLIIDACQDGQTISQISNFQVKSKQAGGTIIHGNLIKTGTVDANVLKANTVIANNIKFTGILEGATGTFSGNLSASSIRIQNPNGSGDGRSELLLDSYVSGTANATGYVSLQGTRDMLVIQTKKLDGSYQSLSSLDIKASGVIMRNELQVEGTLIANKGSGEAIKIAGTTSTSIVYQSFNRGTTRHGYIGIAASATNNLYVSSDTADVMLQPQGGKTDFTFTAKESYNHAFMHNGKTALKLLSTAVTLQVRDSADGAYGSINASDFTPASRRAMKKNIVPYEADALKEILTTPVYQYHYLEENDLEMKHTGLIYEESPVDAIDPSGAGMSLYGMASMTWRGMQQINAKLEEKVQMLESRIAALEGQVV